MTELMNLDKEAVTDLPIFCLVLADINDQNMFMPLAYGWCFRKIEHDSNSIEIHWMVFRPIEKIVQGPAVGEQTKMVGIEFPPRCYKWLMDQDTFLGTKPFMRDDLLGPGHYFRLIWMPPPPDEVGDAVQPSENQRIITPNRRIIMPSGVKVK